MALISSLLSTCKPDSNGGNADSDTSSVEVLKTLTSYMSSASPSGINEFRSIEKNGLNDAEVSIAVYRIWSIISVLLYLLKNFLHKGFNNNILRSNGKEWNVFGKSKQRDNGCKRIFNGRPRALGCVRGKLLCKYSIEMFEMVSFSIWLVR